jgi:hypothetical protein
LNKFTKEYPLCKYLPNALAKPIGHRTTWNLSELCITSISWLGTVETLLENFVTGDTSLLLEKLKKPAPKFYRSTPTQYERTTPKV